MRERINLCRELLTQYLGTSYQFEVSGRLTSTWGYCSHRRRKIVIAKRLIENDYYSLDDLKDTMLHEIAHALAGRGHGHNKYWKTICVKIGARPKRCASHKIDMEKVTQYGIIKDKNRTIFTCLPHSRQYRNLISKKWNVKTLRFSRQYGEIDRQTLEFEVINK